MTCGKDVMLYCGVLQSSSPLRMKGLDMVPIEWDVAHPHRFNECGLGSFQSIAVMAKCSCSNGFGDTGRDDLFMFFLNTRCFDMRI